MNLNDKLDMRDNAMFLRGNVKIYEGDKLILDKDNAITDTFRRQLMLILFTNIKANASSGLTTVSQTGEDKVTDMDINTFIREIRFGRGSSSSLGAKASRVDTALVAPIPAVVSSSPNTPLYINASIDGDLNIMFDYDAMRIQFSADLVNNDSVTYILGELGIFDSSASMLTHLFFDPIFFEPDTTKKIVYTIHLY